MRVTAPPAVLAVTSATFTVVTSEMLPVGLLTPIAERLGVADGTAGLAVTVPGFVAALAAPLLPPAVRRADRRTVLVALLALLAVANGLAALAPSLPVLLAARVLVGVCIGGVWALAAGLGPSLVPAGRAGRATVLIFSGIAVASVLGVPAGTVLGDLAGWRASFAAAGGLALATAAFLALALPPLPPAEPLRLRALLALARTPAVRTGLLVILLLVTGHFAAYTYIRPALERTDGIGPEAIGALLLVYGLAGILGNALGGTAATCDPRRTLLTISATLAATVLLLAHTTGSATASALLVILWGLAYGGVSVTMQTWMTTTSPHALEAISSLFAGTFNVAIGTGALLGGRTADLAGADAPLLLGGLLSATAFLTTAIARPG